MRIITEISEANELLREYADANALIAIYSNTFRKLALRLSVSGRENVIYIVAIGCKYIKGQFDTPKVTIIIGHLSNGDTSIKDLHGKFELMTNGGFSLAEGKDSEFGTSFENFLLDKIEE